MVMVVITCLLLPCVGGGGGRWGQAGHCLHDKPNGQNISLKFKKYLANVHC